VDLGQLAALGEFVGGFAVIASLLFVGVQILRGTQALRLSHFREVSDGVRESLAPAMVDGELAAIALRGFGDLGSLDAVERYRFDLLCLGWLLQFELASMANKEGVYPSDNIVPLRAAVGAWMNTPGGTAWWQERRVWFGSVAQEAIDGALQDAPTLAAGAGPASGQVPS
jgi:hypothetical protein